MTGLLGAVQFLTRIPVRLESPPRLARCVPWFPVVGALIGTVCGLFAAGAAELVPAIVAATLAVLAGLLVTGAFHEDGLADVADAAGGGWDREQRLQILADPLHGSYGVAALVGSVVLRVACVATLGPAAAFGGLVAAHTLGRGVAVGVMGAVPAATGDGLGAAYTRDLTRRAVVAAGAAAIAITAVATGWWVLPLVAAAVVAAAAVSTLAVRKFGGITGDVLGAVEQVAECAVLVVVSGLAARHTLWWR